MKIEPDRDVYLNVCACDEFLSCQKWEKLNFGLFRPKLPELGNYFIHILYVNVVPEKYQ